MSRQPGSLAEGSARQPSFFGRQNGSSPSSASQSSSKPFGSPLELSSGRDGGAGDLSLSNLHLASSPDSEGDVTDWTVSKSQEQAVPFYPSRLHSAPSHHPATASPSSIGPSPSNLGGFERQVMNEWTKRSAAFAPSRASFDSVASGAYYSAEEEGANTLDQHFTPPQLTPPQPASPPTPVLSTPRRTFSRPGSKAESSGSFDSNASPTIQTRRASLNSSHRTPRQSSTKLPAPTRLSGNDASGAELSRRTSSLGNDRTTSASLPSSSGRKSRKAPPTLLSEPVKERSSSMRLLSSNGSSATTASAETDPSLMMGPSIPEIAMPTSSVAYAKGISTPTSGITPVNASVQAQTDKGLLQRWILSIGVVNFDLEKGPDLERLWPPLDISREEKDNIAFSSFPDTSIFDVGDISFSFRVREVPLESSTSSPPKFPSTPSTPNVAISPRSAERTPISRVKDLSRRNGNSSDPGLGVRSLFGRTPSTSRTGGPDSRPDAKQATAGERSSSMHVGGQDAEMVSDGSSIDMAGKAVLIASHEEDDIADAAHITTKDELSTSSVISPAASKVSNSSSSSYIYGYTFFRQKRDASIRRGYFQRSLVILSHLPYIALFGRIVDKLGPLYFEHGEPILEAFSNSVTKWPNPSPGATLPLPMLGSVLWVQLPLGRQSQTSNATEAVLAPSDSAVVGKSLSMAMIKQQEVHRRSEVPVAGSKEEEPLLASIPTTPLVEVFKEALADMWLVWECVLLAEPIFVIGPDPKACSEAVWHLLDICRPIPHAGDFRPFFTIHDYDFRNLAARKQPPAGTIIGCTNAFMAQACSHWPHVLRVGKPAVKLGTAGKYGSKGGSGIKSPGIAGGSGAGGGGPEHLPGFVSKRKRRISKDRPLLKKILELVEKGENIQGANAMLRRYFTDITERFLAPLNRYISSLIPAEGRSGRANVKTFDTDAFLASLKAHGTPLPIRSRSLPTANAVRQGLYLDFLKSPNFAFYLTERIAFYRTRNPEPVSRKTRFEQYQGVSAR